MPAQERFDPASVIASLLAEPQRYGFFQAMRLLERANAQRPAGTPALEWRFANSTSVAFPASEIEAIRVPPSTAPSSGQAAEDAPLPLQITPAFLSLLGAHGALPLAYTEKIATRETYHRDRAARAFLDIFFDRLCVLMHEAWKKYRPALRFEADPRDEFTPLVLALAGLGDEALRERLGDDRAGVQDTSLAYYASALRQRPPSAAWLGEVASDYFGVSIEVEPFVGRWYAIPPEHRSLLGAGAGLGSHSVLGERIYQRDLCLRLHVGPLDARHYQRFLPGGRGHADLQRLLGLLTGNSFEYEVQLILQAEAVEPAQLGQQGRLGWDGFLLTRPADAPRRDACYDISPLAHPHEEALATL